MDAKHARSSTKLQPHCAPIREADLTQIGSRDVMTEAWSHSTERILRSASMKKVERQKVSVVIFILLLFYFLYFILYMGIWLWVFGLHRCMSTMCIPGTQDGQKRASDSLALQAAVNCHVHSGNCSWAVC